MGHEMSRSARDSKPTGARRRQIFAKLALSQPRQANRVASVSPFRIQVERVAMKSNELVATIKSGHCFGLDRLDVGVRPHSWCQGS
jgi:hypothetical protein